MYGVTKFNARSLFMLYAGFCISYPQCQANFWTFGTVCSISLGFSIFFDSGAPLASTQANNSLGGCGRAWELHPNMSRFIALVLIGQA